MPIPAAARAYEEAIDLVVRSTARVHEFRTPPVTDEERLAFSSAFVEASRWMAESVVLTERAEAMVRELAGSIDT
jgi:hypothetical protein